MDGGGAVAGRAGRAGGKGGAGRAGGAGRGLGAMLSAPVSARAWREFAYVLLSLPLAVVYFSLAITGLSLAAGLLVTFVGIPVLAGVLLVCRGFGWLERARARVMLGAEVAEPEPLPAGRPGAGAAGGRGLLGAVAALLKSGSAWRHAVFAVVWFPWAVFAFCTALTLWTTAWSLLLYPLWFWVFPVFTDQPGLQLFQDGEHTVHLDGPAEVALAFLAGLVLVSAAPWVVRGLAAVDLLLVRGLLGPSPLAHRVSELESDRGVVVDTAAADLRRIERDLHDGAQARLAALAMGLGLAKEQAAEDPQAAARLVDEAHGEVKLALRELRDLARGIHPAVLTDRGLDAALSSVASRCTVPVAVAVDLPERPAPAVEGIAYFTVCELLRNIGDHARATAAHVDVWKSGPRLLVRVADDGRGGARPGSGGTGLAGLAERLGAVDGVLVVDSPDGGPTTVTAELPWRSR
ncbi:sensor histidine kinase [Streptomyces globosus]|uniref:histidine kinase n=1 Tax=Streptomyces globosus TaxID=68209 RepID=A0A344TV09_9ACTN|nr:sensor histidine kinase [Streptomyces globosus]AXE22480.1 sensor histidine kinase [Streptomyces globosus]